jgi:hypothetical protein
MENLRRKEGDSRATVSEEGTLVVRAKLHPPLLREDVVARWRLLDWLKEALHPHRLVLISTLDGYRKIKLLATLVHDLPGHDTAHIPNDPLDPDPVFAWHSELIDRLEQGELSEQLAADGGYAGCSEAPGPRALFGTGWSYHRCPSSSLGRPAGSGTQPDPLE